MRVAHEEIPDLFDERMEKGNLDARAGNFGRAHTWFKIAAQVGDIPEYVLAHERADLVEDMFGSPCDAIEIIADLSPRIFSQDTYASAELNNMLWLSTLFDPAMTIWNNFIIVRLVYGERSFQASQQPSYAALVKQAQLDFITTTTISK